MKNKKSSRKKKSFPLAKLILKKRFKLRSRPMKMIVKIGLHQLLIGKLIL